MYVRNTQNNVFETYESVTVFKLNKLSRQAAAPAGHIDWWDTVESISLLIVSDPTGNISRLNDRSNDHTKTAK